MTIGWLFISSNNSVFFFSLNTFKCWKLVLRYPLFGMTAVIDNGKIQALGSLILAYKVGMQDLQSADPLCLSYLNTLVFLHGFHSLYLIWLPKGKWEGIN